LRNALDNKPFLPLVLILLVLFVGFSWHIFGHFTMSQRQEAFNGKLHNAEAKMVLGDTLVMEICRAEKDLYFYPLNGALGTTHFAKALLALDEIDLIVDVLSNGGHYLKRILLNIPGLDETTQDIFYQPKPGQRYNIDALVLRTQVQDLKQMVLVSEEVSEDDFSIFNKKRKALVTRLEENANKISFDARGRLHKLHKERESLLTKDTTSTLIDALMIFCVISFLIILIFQQIRRAKLKLESYVVELEDTENELSEKNQLISTFNASLEEKIERRTEQLRTEINEREKIEAQLVETRKFEAIGQLAGGIAHDFNNVLTIISGYGSMVKKSVQHDERSFQDMETILTAAKKATGLTRQLLAFSRKQVLNPTAIELNTFVGDSQKLLQRLVRENIELSVCATQKPVFVNADISQLDQVLINLIVNARDAIGEHAGEISVAISEAPLMEKLIAQYPKEVGKNYGLIIVADNGHGIPPEIQGKIFDPFYTTKAQGQGTGLGLSTVYGIVKQSHGFIALESTVGQGTKFYVYLPLAENEDNSGTIADEHKYKRVSGKTILIVDDEEAVVQIIEKTLAEAGHTVITAQGSLAAMSKWQQYAADIDLLITDIGMPELNGIELAEKILTIKEDLPVLFVSGYGEFHSNEAKKLNTHNYFLQKPFEAKSLLQQVDAIFS
jgi:signal transduction histidine kinase